MTLIDFEDSRWANAQGRKLCHAQNDTLDDTQTTGVKFIIGEGAMEVIQSQTTGNRFLFFKPEDCNGNNRSTSTLVIRFDTPQGYVQLRHYMDQVEYMRVAYYREHGETGEVENRTVIDTSQAQTRTTEEVVYNSFLPIKELTIITDTPENSFRELEFGLSWWQRLWWRLQRLLRRARLWPALRDWLRRRW